MDSGILHSFSVFKPESWRISVFIKRMFLQVPCLHFVYSGSLSAGLSPARQTAFFFLCSFLHFSFAVSVLPSFPVSFRPLSDAFSLSVSLERFVRKWIQRFFKGFIHIFSPVLLSSSVHPNLEGRARCGVKTKNIKKWIHSGNKKRNSLNDAPKKRACVFAAAQMAGNRKGLRGEFVYFNPNLSTWMGGWTHYCSDI